MSHLPRPIVIAMAAPLFAVALNARTPLPLARALIDSGGRLARLPAGTQVRPAVLADRPAERVTVGASERPRAVLYLHGGGYTLGSTRAYRALAAWLAQAAGAVVYTLDYRLAPEDPYPAALEDAVAAFGDLVTHHGFAPSRVALAGDSAGGGLAVAAARVLTDSGSPPAALGLLSPWTDPSDEQMRARDMVVNVVWGTRSAARYRGGADRADPGYAPIHGRLDGLPPMLIQCAANEMLRPQIGRFARAASAAGVEVEFTESARLWHSAQALAGTLREATDAVTDLGAFLRRHLETWTPGPGSLDLSAGTPEGGLPGG
jgi:monoterpene epsilon-lactone hydrolase